LTRHILVLPSWYSNGRGSGGGYFRDQALALKSAGYDVAMLAPDIHTWRDVRAGRGPARGAAAVTIEHDGLPIYRRNDLTLVPRLPYRNPLAWTRCGLKLARRYFADNTSPDLVHAHCCLNAGVLALALKRRYGIPYVVTEHSAGPATPRWWERDLIRRVVAAASRCIAVSPHLGHRLNCAYPGSSWQYVPNVLGETFLTGAAAREAPVGADRAFVFLCVARLSPEKRHALLLDAFAEALGEVRDMRLRLVGDGPTRASLEAKARALGIAAEVDFAGAVSARRVRAEMEAADAFVLASDSETFGVVVIEALACGLPVVSTASGGPDHLIDPTNGVLVPRGDRCALSAALRDMRRHAGDYDRAAIRAAVLRRCAPDAFARQFTAVIS
jgi:glycosyltransferase involved in cell wall biosynthesis